MKKWFLIFLLCVALAIFPALALAAGGSQDGLQISLTTDKGTYAENETISVSASVTNTNSFAIEGAKLELVLPAGLSFRTSGTTGTMNLAAGQTATISPKVAVGGASVDIPQTGDGMPFGLWILLAFASAIALICLLVFRKKGRNALLGVLLCLALLSSFLVPASARAAVETRNLSVIQIITVDGKSYSLMAKLTYSMTVPDPPSTYGVTVNYGTGDGNYAPGATVTIAAYAPEAGMAFAGWTVVSGGVTLASASSATTTFTMPAGPVEVTAEYAPLPIDFSSNGNFNMTTTFGGLANMGSIIGESGSMDGFGAFSGMIDLTDNTAALALAQAVSADMTLTGLSAEFTLTNAVSLPTSEITVYADIYTASAESDTFIRLPGARVTLAPNLSGAALVDTELSGSTSSLSIPISAGTRVILVFHSEVVAGLDIAAIIIGEAAATATLSMP